MTAQAKTRKIVDLMDGYELLLLFRKYVDECIEEYTTPDKMERPLSFDEWYNKEYLPNIDSLTQIVNFQMKQGLHESFRECRVPNNTVSPLGDGIFDIETLRRAAKNLARKEDRPETFVFFGGRVVYRWSADI